ncbi:YtxH domain-containing protein [Fictibacillus terranigra]|uniref:YtxH domain-containing protein n=1 Tax=Fictibacillus terranigra TaxID=3058424 RepID=A0ABT8E505_9BACL|nr:YtxH domain-containing protein [Fictibacillus sp. CENA-BCM004]MDN4072973.1 YtxH domain-containing protein [Fictibacillus sp. CENA-BCM004]
MKDNKAKKVASSSVYRTVIGGVVGAAVGYLANPETIKRIMSGIKSADLKQNTIPLGKTAMEKISNIKDYGAEKSQQTAKKLKNKTAGLLKKENSEDQENTNANNEKQDHQEVNLQDNNDEQDHQEVNAIGEKEFTV